MGVFKYKLGQYVRVRNYQSSLIGKIEARYSGDDRPYFIRFVNGRSCEATASDITPVADWIGGWE